MSTVARDISKKEETKKMRHTPCACLPSDTIVVYVPGYHGDTTRIIIGKGEGTIISSLLSLDGQWGALGRDNPLRTPL